MTLDRLTRRVENDLRLFMHHLGFREVVVIPGDPCIERRQQEYAEDEIGDEAPTMTIAKGRCESEPISCDNAAGKRPSVATSIVIMMGRSRRTAPSTAASTIVRPLALSWLMYSTMMTPVCTETPKSASIPMPDDTLR